MNEITFNRIVDTFAGKITIDSIVSYRVEFKSVINAKKFLEQAGTIFDIKAASPVQMSNDNWAVIVYKEL
jgi:hypothetical protein